MTDWKSRTDPLIEMTAGSFIVIMGILLGLILLPIAAIAGELPVIFATLIPIIFVGGFLLWLGIVGLVSKG